jgi:hypothetical protein
MKEIRWDPAKSERLKKERGISFEDILLFGNSILEIQNPAHPHQNLLLYELGGYLWVIPCVENDQERFFKTLYPSRKYTRLYREGGLIHENQLEKD